MPELKNPNMTFSNNVNGKKGDLPMQLPSSSLKNPSSQFSHLTPEYPTLQVQAPSLSVQLADSDPTQSQLHS